MEVLEPIDEIGALQVRRDNCRVTVDGGRLVVSPDLSNFSQLDKAKTIAIRGIRGLAETPLSAVGVNFRFQSPEAVASLQPILRHPSDDDLSDTGFSIIARNHRRTVEWAAGVVNISIDCTKDNRVIVLFNFELLLSEFEQLASWLTCPTSEFKATASRLLKSYLRIEPEGLCDGTED